MRSAAFLIIFVFLYLSLRDSVSMVWLVGLMAAFSFIGMGLKNLDRRDNHVARSRQAEGYVQDRLQRIKTEADGERSALDTVALGPVDTEGGVAANVEGGASNQSESSVSDPSRPPLFLRPFLADNITVSNPAKSSGAAYFIPFYRFILPGEVALDDAIRQLRSFSRLVTISAHPDHIGAASVSRPDDNWQSTFIRLARDAPWIIVIPGVRPSTEWEIGRLSQMGLLEKCIFILVPFGPGSESAEEFRLDNIVEMFGRLGLDLAPLGESAGIDLGDALVFGNEGRVVVQVRGVMTGILARSIDLGRLKKCLREMARRGSAS